MCCEHSLFYSTDLVLRRPETSATDKLQEGCVGMAGMPYPPTVCVRRLIGFRPPPDRIPSAVRSDSVRRPIGFRSGDGRILFCANRHFVAQKVMI